MLEILILIRYTKYLARLAETKGRTKTWGALGILFWFGGEFGGFIVGSLAGLEALPLYGVALVCAAVGASIAFAIVKNLGDEARDDGPRPATAMIANASYDPANPYSPPRVE